MRRRWMIPGLAASLVLSACEGGEPRVAPPQPVPLAVRERGRALFLEHCALCHGVNADGRGVRHSALAGRPQDFTDPTWARRTPPARVAQVIRQGVRGTSMAAFRVLDDEQIADLVAYLRSVASQGAQVASVDQHAGVRAAEPAP
jgi:mono/diheme cytochrome c family protein